MDIRPATVADLPRVERLRLQTLSGGDTSAWRGVPLELRVEVRLRLWRTSGHLLRGLLVGIDGDDVVGTVAIDTADMNLRFAVRHLGALTPLGPLRMARFVGVWLVGQHETAPEEAFLHSMAVIPEYRRRGAARGLMAAAEDQARAWGRRVAVVTVERTNKPSLELVRSIGYRFLEPPPRTGLGRLVRSTPTYVRAEKVLQDVP